MQVWKASAVSTDHRSLTGLVSKILISWKIIILWLILYCSVTWTRCWGHDNISYVFKLQKRCVRIILDAQQRHSTVDLFNTLKWVPYNIESDIKRWLMAYKRIIGICPAYRNELLELNNSQHSRNTRGANFTILPRKYTREKEGGRKFCYNFEMLESPPH